MVQGQVEKMVEHFGEKAGKVISDHKDRIMELEAENDRLKVMELQEFRCLLDLFMVSDPWPLEDSTRESQSHVVIQGMLDKKAKQLGFNDWVNAFHKFKPSISSGKGLGRK